ncbi:MAG: APA family basic amino acid/polyamine antiporter [Natronomonas sp.]|jgi:APA family basic amino acid/polyamine antiporter
MVEHTRTLGFRVAFALGLGTMIAAGIFSLSGTAVAEIGSSAVIAFVIAALVAGLTAATYSEFASIYSENGGGYLFSSRTFEGRDRLVYAIGASLFLGYTGTTAFYLATMDEWVRRFIIPASIHLPHGTVGILAAVGLGVLNAQGTEESGSFQVLVTGAKVAVLLAFIGGALTYHPPGETMGTFASQFTTAPVPILGIASMAFITFFGFSAIAASAGEIIEPRKTVPKAIAASIVTVTVLYTFVIIAMVNSPVPAEVIAREGETAMGRVASAFIGPIGMNLIVAGAIFSMISASNASVLAASGIGSLMGRQGHGPRRFSRIHREYGTPFWSVTAATGTIVAMILLFVTLLSPEAGLLSTPEVHMQVPTVDVPLLQPHTDPFTLHVGLGLTALTGFATFNLLLPLSAVNVALIFSRRIYPDMERPFRVPLVPWLPVLGIVANLALITNLPPVGVGVGILVTIGVVGAFLVWGGAPEVEELFEEVVPPATEEAAVPNGGYKVLVPIARPDRAPGYVQLAATIARARSEDPVIQVLNVTEIPEQTPNEVAVEEATDNTEAIRDALDEADLGVKYAVEGHICRDVGFDITQTAREDEADLILMGYPEEHEDVAERVEFEAPCGVFFVSGVDEDTTVDQVNVGAGGGPHHMGVLPVVNALGEAGSEIHLINVRPVGVGGSPEPPGDTLEKLTADITTHVHNVTADSVAEGLVDGAEENGGVLIMGASRTRRLRQWVFGSTPDRVVELAADADVPVIVFAGKASVKGWLEDRFFPIYRYVRRRVRREGQQPTSRSTGVEDEA